MIKAISEENYETDSCGADRRSGYRMLCGVRFDQDDDQGVRVFVGISADPETGCGVRENAQRAHFGDDERFQHRR